MPYTLVVKTFQWASKCLKSGQNKFQQVFLDKSRGTQLPTIVFIKRCEKKPIKTQKSLNDWV
jgi:hypothetical protein